ncbi:MAG TPA: hypothetical protein VF912_01075 [Anaeromyxobacter sp.]
MTGDYCDSVSACCGGTNASYGGATTAYGVTCDKKNGSSPATCDSGQGCNPPGNICGGGGTVNASQNCCYLDASGNPVSGGVLGHSACKPDSGGIMRCFGGPVTTLCPDGWDADRPGCCIEAGVVCQFSDQCCNSVPCVPDAAGVLRCAETNPPIGPTCTPRGATCAVDGDCCSGLACYTVPGTSAKECLESVPGGSCKAVGAGCTTGTQCCTGYCFEGTVCGGCVPNGDTCSSSSSCCSAFCDGGTCKTQTTTACMPAGGSCTVSGDCCSPNTCEIPAGWTHGTCTAPIVVPTCAQTAESCSTLPCCSATDVCNTGVCGPPPPPCSGVSQSCTSDASCCTGMQCFSVNQYEQIVPCAGTACFCDVPAPVCRNTGQSCTPDQACCTGYCAENTLAQPLCTTSSTNPCVCAGPL